MTKYGIQTQKGRRNMAGTRMKTRARTRALTKAHTRARIITIAGMISIFLTESTFAQSTENVTRREDHETVQEALSTKVNAVDDVLSDEYSSEEATEGGDATDVIGIVLSMEDMDMMLYPGTWFSVEEAGIELYLPSDWAMRELDETDEDSGVLYAFCDSISDPTMYLTIVWDSTSALGEGEDAASLYETFTRQGSGYAYPELGQINGIPVVTALADEGKTGVAVFFDTLGNRFVLTFSPVNDPLYQSYVANILCSLCLR